jgi:hypothetical protein
MNKITTLLSLLSLLSASLLIAAEPGSRPVNGVYTGWEPLPEMKGEAQAEWFRLHRVTIQREAVELLGNPVAIRNSGQLLREIIAVSYSGKSSSPDLVFIIRRLYAAGAFWTSTWI